MESKIYVFDGEYSFLRTDSLHSVAFAGYNFRTAVGAYCAMKCPSRAGEFENLCTRDSLDLGHIVQRREDWEKIKLNVMHAVLYAKFTTRKKMKDKLLNTNGTILINGNNYGDTYWGVCCGTGENNLGKLLMMLRSELKNEVVDTSFIKRKRLIKKPPTDTFGFGW